MCVATARHVTVDAVSVDLCIAMRTGDVVDSTSSSPWYSTFGGGCTCRFERPGAVIIACRLMAPTSDSPFVTSFRGSA